MKLAIIFVIIQMAESAIERKQHNHVRRATCPNVCSCYMNGIFYDKGDSWKKHSEPCITYWCYGNYFEVIYMGCEFKGTCKQVNATWWEGCFQYQCISEGNKVYYVLQKSGCAGTSGCIPLGSRVVNSQCIEQECQIKDGCFKLQTIHKGCNFQGICKGLLSSWSDGCSVYQCVNFQHPFVKRLDNKLVVWPMGQYGLLMPKDECPDEDLFWTVGVRVHYGKGKNDHSSLFSLMGEYGPYKMEHKFCLHDDTKYNLPGMLHYRTAWGKGSYCILQYKDKCPPEFESGYILMDDANDQQNLSSTSGDLPTGEYGADTKLQFCCRKDEKTSVPFVLPTHKPFVLFMAGDVNHCQDIKGMKHSVEFFTFDNENTDPINSVNGSVPEVKHTDNNTMVYYCYYETLGCLGCHDNTTHYEEGKVKIDGCITWECRKHHNSYKFHMSLGGCLWKNECKSENHTWVEKSTTTCVYLRCTRKTRNGKVVFEIDTINYDCCLNGHCYLLKSVVNVNCSLYRCDVYINKTKSVPTFVLVKAGCPDNHGNCHDVGTFWFENQTNYCLNKTCNQLFGYYYIGISATACRYQNVCIPVGDTYQSNVTCTSIICTKKGNVLILKSKVNGCVDLEGVCWPVGSSGFSARIYNKYYNKCSCEKNSKNGIFYKCIS